MIEVGVAVIGGYRGRSPIWLPHCAQMTGQYSTNRWQRDEADLASLQMDDFAHSVSPTSARLIKKTADGRVGDRPDGLQRNFDAPDDDGVRKTRT